MRATPYYDHQGITLYCGDSRKILPFLSPADCVITDPVWPNATANIAGKDDPFGLLKETAQHFPRLAKRVVLQFGCDSDPRIMTAIPAELPYFRTCWLEYARPNYKGRLMNGSDVAYVFGTPPPSREGARVIPGRMMCTDSSKRYQHHPCPRRLSHVKWLIRWFANGAILDPFSGSGTTLLAAKEAGLPAIGVEIDETFCARTVERLTQDVFDFEFEAVA